MSSGQELYNALQNGLKELRKLTDDLSKLGTVYATCEYKYRMALAQKQAVLLAEGVKVTVIGDLCRGDEKVAYLRLERDMAKVKHNSQLESINSLKIAIRVTESQIEREWHRK